MDKERKPSFAARFLQLDRRIIYTLVALAVAIPLLFPMGLPIKVTPEVRSVYDMIENLPEGSNILMSADFDPASQPELYPMMKSVMRHIVRKKHKLAITVLWPNGPNLVAQCIEELKLEYPEWTNTVDYVFLGYQVGGAIVIMSVGNSFSETFPKDYYGKSTAGMPIIKEFNKLGEADYMVMFEAGNSGDWWIVYGTEVHDVPVGGGVTAVVAPQYYPYLQAEQLNGIIGGLKGAAEYEKLTDVPALATSAMDSQSMVHALIFVAIVLANIFALMVVAEKRRQAREGR
jgi:hypothetical protein